MPGARAYIVDGLFERQCQLRSSNGASLRDTITIYFRSTDTSEPFHLKYTVAGAPAKSQNCSTLKRASDFTTDLKLEHPQRVEKCAPLEIVC